MSESRTVQEFINFVRSGSAAGEVANVDCSGLQFPIKVIATHATNRIPAPLVIFFHGAVRQSVPPAPVFEGTFAATPLRRVANVISIADPTLLLDPVLKTTWYAGSRNMDVPAALRALVASLVAGLKPSRVIFAGGSTGGHPAIYQSAFVPNSVAVACNPIGVISNYNDLHITEYRDICWPGVGAGELPYADMATAPFVAESSSTVIFLCNSRDLHFPKQSALLHADLFERTRSRNLAVVSSFFTSHSGHSYPPPVWLAWIKAAIAAPTSSFADIGEKFEAAAVAPQAKPPAKAYSPSDIALAQRVYQQAAQAQGRQ
ncbi:hypothetical protein [Achromobacter insolitus]|uniref:hypothetical protein n=1 Tax=Achromobacter insolitus TaxID=217204 RepID=UPI0020A56FCB|nr:hypothetical protein [Achromobacter insolitus]MCP1404417.1 hypothetical protein [Achromobacter insolitus]